jgi:hypothetical protein
MPTSLCEPLPVDTARAESGNRVSVASVDVEIPRRFHSSRSGPDFRVFESGGRRIVVARGTDPHMFSNPTNLSRERSCTTTIDGRTVEIVKLTATIQDAAMAPTGYAGNWHILVARWIAGAAGRDFTVSIISTNRSQVEAARNVFWTVRFPSDAPKPD